MKKLKAPLLLIGIIFLAAFNAIFFILSGFEHPDSVWIAYAMIHFGFVMLIFTPLFAGGGKTSLEAGAPLSMLSTINFAIHFVVGLIFIFAAPESYKAEIIIYIILVAVYLIAFFALMFANANTRGATKRQSKEVFYIKNQASKIKILIGRIDDNELNRLLESAADDMHSSPSRSSKAASSVETGIALKVRELERAINDKRSDDAKNICQELKYLIDERNRVININY